MTNVFVVESMDHCFLCLKQVTSDIKLEDKNNIPHKLFNSLQSLSCYLKMDMRKIFIRAEEEIISEEVLNKMEKLNVKVELCNECTILVEKFSRMHQKLEKIEMEVASILNLIQCKLSLEEGELEASLRDLADSDFSSDFKKDWSEKLGIFQILRKEANQKSSRKLRFAIPRVQVHNLSNVERNRRKTNKKSKFTMASKGEPSPRWENNSEANVKMEYHSENLTYLFPDDQNLGQSLKLEVSYSEEFQNFPYQIAKSEGPENTKTDIPQVKEQNLSKNEVIRQQLNLKGISTTTSIIEQNTNCERSPDLNIKIEWPSVMSAPVSDNHSFRSENSNMPMQNADSENFQKSPSASTTTAYQSKARNVLFSVVTSKAHSPPPGPQSIRTETGYYKCAACLKEFKMENSANEHYRSIHLNEKYKCTFCGKIFDRVGSIYLHHKVAHVGRRFNCNVCSSSFKCKSSLASHLLNTSCGKGLAPKAKPKPFVCQFSLCRERFTLKNNLRVHLRGVHSELREHECKLCGKKFKWNNSLRMHIVRCHPTT